MGLRDSRRLALVCGALVGCGHARETRSAPPPATRVTVAAPASSPEPIASPPASATRDAGAAPDVLGLPVEPWYRDKPEHSEECVAELAEAPLPHFPAPFEACDTRNESWSSPPGRGGLHFHYRGFSVAATTAHREQHPKTCCYLVWEFPRRHPPG